MAFVQFVSIKIQLFLRQTCQIFLFLAHRWGYALISGHPAGVTPGNPRAFAQRRLQISSTPK